jgi:hypothetical protein
MNAYLERRAKHAIGKQGRASEKKLAKQLGVRPRPASGAMEGAKGDIPLPGVLMEAKSTTSDSLGVKLDWLAKIGNEARSEGKSPALAVTFVDGVGNPRKDGQWVMIPLNLWNEHIRGDE